MNLFREPGRERLREKVVPTSNFEVPGELAIERLVAQHEQGGPRFHTIVDTAEAQQGDGLGRCPAAAPEIGPVHLIVFPERLR